MRGRSIEERPAHVGPGGEFGHWEIDTVLGRRAGGGAAVLTLVEKRTRYLVALPLSSRSVYSVETSLLGLHEEYGARFAEVFKSVTSDNGAEFSELSRLESWGAAVYFAHPYRSGERGQNERHNGLLRRFLPKGTALDPYTADALFWIADEINRLPRRQLYPLTGWLDLIRQRFCILRRYPQSTPGQGAGCGRRRAGPRA